MKMCTIAIFARRLHLNVFWLRRDLIKHGTLKSTLSFNLQTRHRSDAIKYAATELSVSEDHIKKYINSIFDEYAKNYKIDTDLISDMAYDKILQLMKSRSYVADSMKTLHELGKMMHWTISADIAMKCCQGSIGN